MIPEHNRPIKNCQIIASSGCHRYQYWGEQFLFNEDLTTGWCTPSRKYVQDEFIVADVGQPRLVNRIRMLSRVIHTNAGFPSDFKLLSSLDGDTWSEIFTQGSFSARPGVWHEWDFTPTEARYLKLLITNVAKRPEGKYFVQFMALRIYEHPDAVRPANKTIPMRVLDTKQLERFLPDQANKFGFYSSAHISASLWCLSSGQEVPLHVHPDGDEISIVLSGEGYYFLAEDVTELGISYEPSPIMLVPVPEVREEQLSVLPSQKIQAGMVAMAPRGTVHGIRCADHCQLVVITINAPIPEGGVFSVRKA